MVGNDSLVDTEAELHARIVAFTSQVPDYDEVIARADHVPIPPHVAHYLKTSASGPALGYHLAKNLALFEQIVGLPAGEAVKALVEVEAKLSPPAVPLEFDGWAAFAEPPAMLERMRIEQQFAAREAAFAAAVPAYKGAAEAFHRSDVPAYIIDFAKASPLGPEIIYYLGSTLDLLTALVALPRPKALDEMASLERWIRHLLTLRQWTPPAGALRN